MSTQSGREPSYWGLFAGLALAGVTVDQATKYGVFRWLYNDGHGGYWDCLPGVFRLVAHYPGEGKVGTGWLAALRTWSGDTQPVVNHGALFGLGGEHTYLANWVFAAVSLVAAVAIGYWSTRPATRRDWTMSTALGLILAGCLGNLYDRLVFGGVRDFLHFYWIEWPVFNVADCCLVCGAGILLLHAFLTRQEAAPQPAPQRPELAKT